MSVRDRSPIIKIKTNNFNLENTETYSNNNSQIKMANITQLEINMAKDMLPEYSGGSKNLAYFIKQVESYINLLKKPEEGCLFNVLLFEQVKSKLIGDARDVLITSNVNKWSELKISLLQRFGDPRSEELLVHDLTTCFQKHSESYEQYFENIKYKLQILLEHVSIRNPNNDIRISKENMYTNQALSTFKAGILEPYCTHLMNLNIMTLEQALYECRKFDNEKAQVSFMNFMRNRSKPTINKKPFNSNRIPNSNSNNKFNFYPAFNRNYNVDNQQTSSRIFPRGPVNVQPRPIQQNYPTNSQVFKRNQQQKPTPMSISTRNTSPRQQYQNVQNPKPNFISEELYNLERPDSNSQIDSFNNNYKNNNDPYSYNSDCDEANFRLEASEQ